MNKIHVNINHEFLLDSSFLEELKLYEDSEIIIDFISDFKSAKVLRNFISCLSDKLNIDDIWKSRLILVIDELNNNAIEYWSNPWELNCFKININYHSNELILNCEVIDTGKWLKSKKASEMYNLRDIKKEKWFDDKSIRGRGLFMIINKLVDKLYFKDSDDWGLIVWVDKKFEIQKR